MSDVQVKFMHPTDGRIISVTLDAAMTTQEIISELISNDFITPSPQGYNLAVREGSQLQVNESLLEAEIENGVTLRVIPATDAGGIPGFTDKKIKKLSLNDIQNSPQALTIIVHLYNDLQEKYEKQVKELNHEKTKSNDRFISTILLIISQVILSIGTNLLTDNNPIAALVLIAGGLQTLLALYLAFRKPKKHTD